MLTTKQITQLSALLNELELRLRGEVRIALRERLLRDPSAQDTGSEDHAGQSAADLQDGIDTGMLTRDSDELIAIEQAKARLADGTYGECIDCNLPIDFTRLIALPSAERCLACQDRYERYRAPGAGAFSPSSL
jgi:DnaK suppressor protein